MKNDRQNAIVEIISKHSIEKQEVLIDLLKKAGYDAAQATVSRDLRQMNITKVSDGKGGLKYALPIRNNEVTTNDFEMAFAASIVSVAYAMNNVVIKTKNGMANAVAVGLDKIEIPEILGCVAGDDTIIIVTRTEIDADYVCDNVKKLMEKFSPRR